MCNLYHKMKLAVFSVININAAYNTSSISLTGGNKNTDLHIVQYLLKMSRCHPADCTYPRVDTGTRSILAPGPATSSSTWQTSPSGPPPPREAWASTLWKQEKNQTRQWLLLILQLKGIVASLSCLQKLFSLLHMLNHQFAKPTRFKRFAGRKLSPLPYHF